jgi:hypothetical protein
VRAQVHKYTVWLTGLITAHVAAVIWSPNPGVFAVSAAGILRAFSYVVDALPGQRLRRRPGTNPLVAALLEVCGLVPNAPR